MSPYIAGTKSFLPLFLVILIRYLVLAAIAFLIFYVWKKNAWLTRKLQQRFPRTIDYVREVSYSFVTAIIFTVIGLLIFATPLSGYTQAYDDIRLYGMPYFIVSIVLSLLMSFFRR